MRSFTSSGATDLAWAKDRLAALRPKIAAAPLSPLMWLDSIGTITRTYKSKVSPRDGLWSSSGAVFAGAPGGDIILANTRAYHIERITPAGELKWSMYRTLEWLDPTKSPKKTGVKYPSRSSVRDIVVDSVGRLWVLLYKANEKWVPLKLSAKAGDPIPYSEMDRRYDSMIEVFAPSATTPFIVRQFEQAFQGFARPGVLWRYVETKEGSAAVELSSIKLHGT